MISYIEGLNIIRSTARLLPSRSVPLFESLKEVCAERIVAKEETPPFDNSAMDGFAIKANTTLTATLASPVTLSVKGMIAAGECTDPLFSNEISAIEIMTGAPIPSGADAVIRIEDVKIERGEDGTIGSISISRPVEVGDQIRRSGEDFQIGDLIIEPGTRILPHHIMTFASQGIAQIPIRQRPRIAILTTGKELVPHDEFIQELPPGKIRNSNAPYLFAVLKLLGAEPLLYGTIPDDIRSFLVTLDRILDDSPDIIITTGAVSMGRFDFIAQALNQFGAKILFHKVAIRPGKPILFAKLGDSPRAPVFFGLPGNPVSAAVGTRFFVEPYIRALLGQVDEKPISVPLLNSISKKEGLRCFGLSFVKEVRN